jgi:NADH-ubiquinone oxidoreductase chain 6
MLINVRISELLSNSSQSLPLAIFIGIAFNLPVYNILPFSITSSTYINGLFNNISSLRLINMDKEEIFFVTSKI